jgi:hypothetical protein
VKCLFFIYIKVVMLIFVNAAAVTETRLALADSSTKDSGRDGVCPDEQLTGDGSTFTQDPPFEVETTPTRDMISRCAMLLWCHVALGPSTVMLFAVC